MMKTRDRYTVDLFLVFAALLLLDRACRRRSRARVKMEDAAMLYLCVYGCLFPSYEMLYLYITMALILRKPSALI